MDDAKKIIPVFSGSNIEVQKLALDLRDAGIEVLIKDYDTTAMVSGFANISRPAMQLCILETEVARAKPIVKAFKELFNL